MLIISRTPLRISFFGGGTDYPDFYREHGGAVLGTTINQYTHISVKTLKSAFFDHNFRVAYSKTELVKKIEEIEHPSVRESLRFMKMDGNLDVHIFSDLPAKTGLGSSSSFTVGFLKCLFALQGKGVSKQGLAENACFVEQTLIKENVGSQDQFFASYGGLNVMEFGAKCINVRPITITKEKEQWLQDHMLVFFTGLTRFASDIAKDQLTKTKKGLNTAYLKEMLAMVYEAEKILTSSAIVESLGKLLDQSWQIKKKLSGQITNPMIDQAYEAALNAGAYGGKLCGAGGGGFLMFLAPLEAKEKIRSALKGLLEVDFKFENEGSTIIYCKG